MIADRTGQLPDAAPGTGDISLAGTTAATGLRTWRSAFGSAGALSISCPYLAETPDRSVWEYGNATWNGSALTNRQVSSNSASTTTPINLPASAIIYSTIGTLSTPENWPFLSATGAPTGVPSNGFNTMNFNNIVRDTHNMLPDPSNGQMIIRQDGLYEIAASQRFNDGTTKDLSFALGVGTSNSDQPHVKWKATLASSRQGAEYYRKDPFALANVLRFYIYMDSFNAGMLSTSITIQRVG